MPSSLLCIFCTCVSKRDICCALIFLSLFAKMHSAIASLWKEPSNAQLVKQTNPFHFLAIPDENLLERRSFPAFYIFVCDQLRTCCVDCIREVRSILTVVGESDILYMASMYYTKKAGSQLALSSPANRRDGATSLNEIPYFKISVVDTIYSVYF